MDPMQIHLMHNQMAMDMHNQAVQMHGQMAQQAVQQQAQTAEVALSRNGKIALGVGALVSLGAMVYAGLRNRKQSPVIDAVAKGDANSRTR